MRAIYDADNELTKVVRTDGGTLLTQYDANGNAIATTAAPGRQTIDSYNTLNCLSSVTNPRGAVTMYQYDLDSNVIITTDALG